MDAFHQYPCAFCPRAFRSENDVYEHTMGHRESERITVSMNVDGRSLILAKPSLKSDMYSCPASNCGMVASLGSVWAHWTSEHQNLVNSQPSTKRRSDVSEPQSNKRHRVDPPPTSTSSTSRPSTSSAPAYSASQSSAPASTPAPGPVPAHYTQNNTQHPPPAQVQKRNPFVRIKLIDLPVHIVLPNGFKGPDIFQFVGEKMSLFKNACPYHSMILGLPSDGIHTNTFNCWEPEVITGSELIAVYKPQFGSCRKRGRCCHNCFSPETEDFGHQIRTNCGLGMENRGYEDWWRSGSYLIFRCPELRKLVFGKLGLDAEAFAGDLVKYTEWLFQGASFDGKRVVDPRLSNLVMVMYSYIVVSSEPGYKVPGNGFTLDIPKIDPPPAEDSAPSSQDASTSVQDVSSSSDNDKETSVAQV